MNSLLSNTIKPTPMDRVEGTLRDGVYIKPKPSHYSAIQISLYLDRVGYCPKDHCDEKFIADGLFPATLESLERLILLHLLAFPFENTEMHYTQEHTAGLDPQNLYRRFMDERKGSYCFGQNSFFLHVLRGLGYRSYNATGKGNNGMMEEPTEYPPPSHPVILVQPIPDTNVTYLVDVGLGTGPTRPIMLTDSDKYIVFGINPSERFRMRRRSDPRSSLELNRCSSNFTGLYWAVERQQVNKFTPDPSRAPWIPMCIFTESEFYENDIYNASFSFSTSSHGQSLQNRVLVIKSFLLDSENNLIFDANKTTTDLAATNGDISQRNFGRAILAGGKLAYTSEGKRETRMLETEDERIRVLKDVFGVVITEAEKENIKGLPSAL